jgi:gamma-glutamyltranspeptidase/glutathione hydrolase
MKTFKYLKKLSLIIVIPGSLIITFILIDILLSRNLYHPLSYLYSFFNFLNCRQSSLNACQKDPLQNKTTIVSQKAMVVSSQHEATKVGVEILKSGGNAIDAAVAVGYALAVTAPCCGNLGGGGFMLIRLADGSENFIDFRETAPLSASTNMYVDDNGKVISEKSTNGYLAVATPGTVKGLNYALSKYGNLKRQQVIKPAIKLAKEGFILTEGDIKTFKRNKNKLEEQNVSKIFRKNDRYFKIGEKLIQTDLSQTLSLISEKGEIEFYQGTIAHKIVKASQENGGILSKKDLAEYEIKERKPIRCNYRGYQIITAPPPGGGTVVCQMLNVLEGYSLEQLGYSEQSIHLMLSAMLYAYADRNNYFGDPDFVDIPLKKLISKEYAAQIREKIPEYNAPKLSQENTNSGNHTTHYSVIDQQGNAVAVTYTINSPFGAGVIAPETGFFLNNEMNDFTVKLGTPNQFGLIQGEKNIIEPQKRPLSSMSPTIVTKNNKIILITGSPGGSTIPTTVLQVIIKLIDFKMSPEQAVNTSKFHYQGSPNVVVTEPYALSSEVFSALWKRGYRVIPFIPWGAAESIYINENNAIYGVQDSRKLAGEAKGF